MESDHALEHYILCKESVRVANQHCLAIAEEQAEAGFVRKIWHDFRDAKMFMTYYVAMDHEYNIQLDYAFDKLRNGSRDFGPYLFYLRMKILAAKALDLHIAEFTWRFASNEWEKWLT